MTWHCVLRATPSVTSRGRRGHRVHKIMVVLALAFTAGCQRGSFLWKDLDTIDATPETSGAVHLETARGASLTERIRAEQNRVVLVDFWATTCGPCRAAFPHTMELMRRYREDGLTVLTVSLDSSDATDEVREFLRSQGAEGIHFIGEHGFGSKSFVEFEIESGAIPYYKLYDRQGNLRFTFTGASDEIERRIRELLAESQAT